MRNAAVLASGYLSEIMRVNELDAARPTSSRSFAAG
jgi:hypothetical protein